MRLVIVCLLALLVGFVAGQQYGLSQSENPSDMLRDIENGPLAEYQNLTDENARYEKAQEIYGKVFQIFLATMALKIDQSKWQSLAKNPPAPVPVPQEKTVNSAPQPQTEVIIPAPASIAIESAALDDESDIPAKEEAKLFGRSGRLADPQEFIAKSQLIIASKSLLMQRVQGIYSGEIRLVGNADPKIWRVRMESDFTHDGKAWKGDGLIELSNSEQGVFSRSQGSGDNNAFSQHPDASGVLLVEASPDITLSLRYNKRNNSFRGHAYRKAGRSKQWTYIGEVVRLSKQ
jgi:hypothetical protein